METFIAYRYHRRDLDFSEIDHMFADEFFDYLTLHQYPPLSEVTARKQVKWTRQIVKICVKKKLSPVIRSKVSFAQVEIRK